MTVQPLGTLARTHTCGELTAADAGQTVVLLAWVHRVRDLGGVMFFDLRDRYGITQVVVRDEALSDAAKRLRPELRVLLASGYPASVLASDHSAGDDGEFPFLSKPYRAAELANKLRALQTQSQ